MLDFACFQCLTFDCYGTLIDWESGILSALRPILQAHGHKLDDEQILELYAPIEAEVEAGEYKRYREVLREVARRMGAKLSLQLSESEINALPESLKRWPPFPDTVNALQRLKSRYKLCILSNTDDDLFAESAKLLQVPFDYVITAQQVGSYKPSLNHFREGMKRTGLPADRILHVAQSIFHDVVPAKSLGISTVWVNRRAGKPGTGATVAASEKPDVTVTTLKELADLAGC